MTLETLAIGYKIMEKFVLERNSGLNSQKIAEHIIAMEKSALDKWFNGDTSGYADLWSKDSFSYFDAVVTKRVDSHTDIMKFLSTIDGKLFADSYDFHAPRVQLDANMDMAVLTYQLFAKSTLMDMAYNCIEIYKLESDGKWRVVHSTWSCIRPMDVKSWPTKDIV